MFIKSEKIPIIFMGTCFIIEKTYSGAQVLFLNVFSLRKYLLLQPSVVLVNGEISLKSFVGILLYKTGLHVAYKRLHRNSLLNNENVDKNIQT